MSEKIILPWPPTALSPNIRQHWSKLAKAKRAYRAECSLQALTQGVRKMHAKSLHVSLTFVPPTRRAYDLDNLLSRMKSGLDGLCDVLGVDDSKWTFTISKSADVGGMVIVEVTQ